MAYWLLKSEPDAFGIEDLKARRDQTEPWDGVRNYQARNMMRDEMQVGDLGFFYHSNVKEPGVVGVIEIASAGYPDPTAFDPDSKYYDPKSDPNNPRWYLVDVRYVRDLKRIISLSELKDYADDALAGFPLLRKGNRLSIMPITDQQWEFILSLEDG